MTLGPILRRELVAAARRPRTYRQRCATVAAGLVLMGTMYAASFFLDDTGSTIGETAQLARSVAGTVLVLQVVLTGVLVPALVAGAIAEEKERRTLPDLLATRLTNLEIVVGKLAAGLCRYGACLVSGVPIVAALPLLGGIDPRMVAIAYAGTATTAVFLAALSILVSTGAKGGGQAVRETVALVAVWNVVPLVLPALITRACPRALPWVMPANSWLLASTPASVLLSIWGRGPGWPFFESVAWMMALQLCSAIVLVALAVARLRAAFRADDGNAPGLAARLVPPRRHPPCGDDPVLWKEKLPAHARGLKRLVRVLFALILTALTVYATFHFARPAVLEWLAVGNGRNGASSDTARLQFNEFLRVVTSWAEFLLLLVVASAASEGVALERARETWDGLIATPLDGRAILRAKMIGAVWKGRAGVWLLLAVWSAGLLAGSLHPLGFAAAVVLLAVSTWFMAAVGTYLSLVSRDASQASTRTLSLAMVLALSFLPAVVPNRYASVLWGMGSAPFVNALAHWSYRDVREVLSFAPPVNLPRGGGVAFGRQAIAIAATYLLAVAVHTVAAVGFSRAAFARFDRVVGRPERPATTAGPRSNPAPGHQVGPETTSEDGRTVRDPFPLRNPVDTCLGADILAG